MARDVTDLSTEQTANSESGRIWMTSPKLTEEPDPKRVRLDCFVLNFFSPFLFYFYEVSV